MSLLIEPVVNDTRFWKKGFNQSALQGTLIGSTFEIHHKAKPTSATILMIVTATGTKMPTSWRSSIIPRTRFMRTLSLLVLRSNCLACLCTKSLLHEAAIHVVLRSIHVAIVINSWGRGRKWAKRQNCDSQVTNAHGISALSYVDWESRPKYYSEPLSIVQWQIIMYTRLAQHSNYFFWSQLSTWI